MLVNVALGKIEQAIFITSQGCEKTALVRQWISMPGPTEPPTLQSAWSMALNAVIVNWELFIYLFVYCTALV